MVSPLYNAREARASEIGQFGSRSALQQIPDLIPGKWVLEEVALIDTHVLPRKRLFRSATGRSPYPAVEINLVVVGCSYRTAATLLCCRSIPHILDSRCLGPSIS